MTTGGIHLEKIYAEIVSKVERYLKSIVFQSSEMIFNRIGYFLLDTAGVKDFVNLSINGKYTNISIPADTIAVLDNLEVLIHEDAPGCSTDSLLQ